MCLISQLLYFRPPCFGANESSGWCRAHWCEFSHLWQQQREIRGRTEGSTAWVSVSPDLWPPLPSSAGRSCWRVWQRQQRQKMSPQSATSICWCTASLVAPHIKIPSSPLETGSGRPGLFKAVPKYRHGPELDLFHMSWETQLVRTTALYWVQLCATHSLLEMKTFPLSKAFLKVDNL